MNHKYRGLLISSLAILPLSIFVSAFGAIGTIAKEPPSYLDRQQGELVSQSVLMGDTSPQAYTEESTKKRAEPFSSFYVGAGANISRTEVTVDASGYGYSGSLTEHNDDFGANAVAGGGLDLRNFYLGIEGFFNYIAGGVNHGVKVEDYSYGGDLRFGYIFTRNFMLYLLGGASAIEFSHDYSSEKKTELGLIPGVGVEYLFNDHWGVRAQYTYTIYPQEEFDADLFGVSIDTKVRRHTLGLDLVYRF